MTWPKYFLTICDLGYSEFPKVTDLDAAPTREASGQEAIYPRLIVMIMYTKSLQMQLHIHNVV